MMKIFFDTEFTGLDMGTSLISIGLVAEKGHKFYAELTDYKKDRIDNWLQKNVIENLGKPEDPDVYYITGNTGTIAAHLERWLQLLQPYPYEEIEMWADCLAYDWVLFCNLWGGAFNLPKKIFHMPFDLTTAFKLKDIDPNINREKFAGMKANGKKHNALWDAQICRACAEKLGIF